MKTKQSKLTKKEIDSYIENDEDVSHLTKKEQNQVLAGRLIKQYELENPSEVVVKEPKTPKTPKEPKAPKRTLAQYREEQKLKKLEKEKQKEQDRIEKVQRAIDRKKAKVERANKEQALYGCKKKIKFHSAKPIPEELKFWIQENIDKESYLKQQDLGDEYYWLISMMLTRYMPGKGYGFIHYSSYPTNLIKAAIYTLTEDTLYLKEHHIHARQCERYSMDPKLAQEFNELIRSLKKPEDLKLLKNLRMQMFMRDEKRVKVSTVHNKIRMNVVAMEADPRTAQYLTQWMVQGIINEEGYYHQELYVRKGEEDLRQYEIYEFGYQNMPSELKEICFFPEEQMNIDMVSAHPKIAANFDEDFKEVMESDFFLEHKPDLKKVINPGLYGQKWWNMKKTMVEINIQKGLEWTDEVMDGFIGKICNAVNKIAVKVGVEIKKIWRYFHAEERKIMIKVENHLKSLGLSFVNMHDGLVVDGKFDLSELNKIFNGEVVFAEKPIWDGKVKEIIEKTWWQKNIESAKKVKKAKERKER